jgi:dTDP-4-amino-4,6-dideoxygalactose transaminase
MDSALAVARLGAMSAAFQPRGWWLATRLGLHKIGDQETSWGFKVTGLTDAQAAVGREQLARLDSISDRRRANAAQLMRLLSGVDFAHVPSPYPLDGGDVEPGFLRLPLILDSEKRRDALFQALWDAGIGAGKMYKLTLAEFFPAYADTDYPGAHAVSRRLLTLPTHHYLREADFERVAEVLARMDGGSP